MRVRQGDTACEKGRQSVCVFERGCRQVSACERDRERKTARKIEGGREELEGRVRIGTWVRADKCACLRVSASRHVYVCDRKGEKASKRATEKGGG